jgi:ubiquinone/menaquinone biosynthesis C-methylase UbiE
MGRVGSQPRPEAADAIEHSASFASTYSSQAYGASSDDGATRATAAWLEAQSLHPFLRDVAERSLARMALQPGESVLDVGCGTGVFLPGLAAAVGPAGRVVGLDHSAAFLEDARTRLAGASLAGRVELVEGDVHRLPFADGTFDAAHCERVLMHVEDPALAIREMLRVVRPGGRALVAEVYAHGARIDHPDPEAERLISAELVSGIRNGSMGIALRGLLIESGFADVGGEVVGYFEETLDQDEAEEWSMLARGLAARGDLEPARAEAAIAAMEDQRARGTHCGVALIFVVSGRVPGEQRNGA